MNVDPWAMIGSILFSGLGGVFFAFGRRQEIWQRVLIGVILMAYPFFLNQGWLFWLIGVSLIALYFKDWEK